MSRRTLLFVARVAGWLIVPLYVAGVCTNYLLERSAGLPNEHSAEDVVFWVGWLSTAATPCTTPSWNFDVAEERDCHLFVPAP